MRTLFDEHNPSHKLSEKEISLKAKHFQAIIDILNLSFQQGVFPDDLKTA